MNQRRSAAAECDLASIETAEAIVIGSGFGGAVAACRLAQAGYGVVILERGRRYDADDFPPLPHDSQVLSDLRQWTWQSEQGLWDIVDLHELIAVQVAGYGGGSLLYGNVHLRPPESVFDARWPEVYRGGKLLEDYYDLVAYMLDAAPIEAHGKLGPLVKVDQLRQATARLERGAAFFSPPLTISREKRARFGREQNACIGCGSCCSGCPEGAKNTLDFNYLALAEQHGASVATQCEVVEIVQGDDDVWRMRCVDHLHGTTRWFATPSLFLCAGSIHSTRLLAGAKLRGNPDDDAHVQRRVGVGYAPGGDAIGVVYDTEHPQHPSIGPAITTTTVHWDAEAPGSFFLIQDGGYAPQLERLIGALRGPLWLGRNRLTRREDASPGPSQPSPGRETPRESARRSGIPLLQGAAVLPSPVDAVLDVVASGDWQRVVPAQVQENFPAFLDDVRDLMLLPEIVDRTMDGALRAKLRESRLTRWLFRWFAEEGLFMRALRRGIRYVIRKTFGSDLELSDRALRALLTASDLRRDQVAKRLLGYDATRAKHRTMLLAMGRDAALGSLRYDPEQDRLVADLDLFALGPGYTRQEQLMMDLAKELGGELRTSPAWAFLGKPITVHNQGGCPMSDLAEQGVTQPDGQVHACPGLYVMDGAALCTSVGVNPAPTIAAIAERNIEHFIESRRDQKPPADGWAQYKEQRQLAAKWKERAMAAGWMLRPPGPDEAPAATFRSKPLGLKLREAMEGYCSEPRGLRTDADYRVYETRGRPEHHVRVKLELSIDDLGSFFQNPEHELALGGSIDCRLPGEAVHTGRVAGHVHLLAPPHKEYGIRRDEHSRRSAQRRLAGRYRARALSDPRSTPEQRFMRYRMELLDKPGWVLSGYKRMRNDPGLDAWRDTTSLFVKVTGPAPARSAPGVTRAAGVLHVDLSGFLFDQIHSIEITQTKDPARIVWAAATFATFFFGSLQRIYLPQVGGALDTLLAPPRAGAQRSPLRSGI